MTPQQLNFISSEIRKAINEHRQWHREKMSLPDTSNGFKSYVTKETANYIHALHSLASNIACKFESDPNFDMSKFFDDCGYYNDDTPLELQLRPY